MCTVVAGSVLEAEGGMFGGGGSDVDRSHQTTLVTVINGSADIEKRGLASCALSLSLSRSSHIIMGILLGSFIVATFAEDGFFFGFFSPLVKETR